MDIERELWHRTGHWIEPLSQGEFEKFHIIEKGLNEIWYQNNSTVYQNAVVEAIRSGVSPYQIRECTNNHLTGVLWANTTIEREGASPLDNFNRCVNLLKLSPAQIDEVFRRTISYTVVTEYPPYRYPSCCHILEFTTKQGFAKEKQNTAILDGIGFLLLASQRSESERVENRITSVLAEAGLTEKEIFSHPLLQHAARSYFAKNFNSSVSDILIAEFYRERFGFQLLSPDSRKFLAIREILLAYPFDEKTVNEIIRVFDTLDVEEILRQTLEDQIDWINPNLAEMLYGWETVTLSDYLQFARQYKAYVLRVGSDGRLQPPHSESQLSGPHPFAALEIPPQTPKEKIWRERLERLFAKARMLEQVFTPFIDNNIPYKDPLRNIKLQERGELESEEKALSNFLIERQARVRKAYEILKNQAHGDYKQMGIIMYEWMCKQAGKLIRSAKYAPDVAFHPLGIIVWLDEGGPEHNDFEYIHGHISGGFFLNNQKAYHANFEIISTPIIVVKTQYETGAVSTSLSHEVGHGVAHAYKDFLRQHNRLMSWGEAVGISEETKKELGKELTAKWESVKWQAEDVNYAAFQKRRLKTLRQSPEWNIIQKNIAARAKDEIIATLFDGYLSERYGDMRGSEGLYGYITDFHIGTRNDLGIAVWDAYQAILEKEMETARLLEEAYRVPGFEEKRRLLKWILMQIPMNEWFDELYRLGIGEEAELLVNIYRLCDADPFVHKENTLIRSYIRNADRTLSQKEQKILYDDYWRLYFQLQRNPSLLYTNQLKTFIKYLESKQLSAFK